MNLWVKLDKEPFPLKTQLSNFGPIKSIYFCVALGEKITLKTKKRLFFFFFLINQKDKGS